MKIDVTYNFIKDIDENIDRFVTQYLDNHDKVRDIDTYSQTLREYQACIYKKALQRHNNIIFDLKLGNNPEYDYLYWNDSIYYGDDLAKSRFASDSIVNMQERYKPVRDNDFVPDLTDEGIKRILKEYVKSASTIGGEIIFPKHPNSINAARGRNPKIKDRFDLTLECIKRFYEQRDNQEKEYNPLYDALKADEKFFDLFDDFGDYVEFFYLDGSYVQDGEIKFFIGGKPNFDNNFTPLPTSLEEWEQLYKNQMACLAARNEKIAALFSPNDSIK